MDGENAWEYYQDNGFPFLTKLYGALARTDGLKAATFSEVLQLVPERRTLDRVHPGSWINANYGIWIGHPEKNRGWDSLSKARGAAVGASPLVASLLGAPPALPGEGEGEGEELEELEEPEDCGSRTGMAQDRSRSGAPGLQPAPSPHEEDESSGGGVGSAELGEETARLVCDSLHAAQGSDWFWWYGDDHFSPHAGRFDLLFRRHLMNVYRLLGLDVPAELYEPIKKQFPAGFVREPAALITPAITGIVTDYFEWLAAGLYDLTKQASAMHAAETLLQSFFYGFDRNYFYFRIDGVQSLEKVFQQDDCLSLHLIHGSEYRMEMELGACEAELMVKSRSGWIPSGTVAHYCIGRIVEARIPLPALNLSSGDKLFTYLTYTRNRDELGRWPVDTPLLLNYAGPDLEMETWLI
jgi:alpha-amylase/alpha-mannosidase (GH57 family)